MSRLWNKAYVTAHYQGAYASRRSPAGRLTKAWHIYVPQVVDVSGVTTWHFKASAVTEAWKLAAEAIEKKLRKRDDPRHRQRIEYVQGSR
jgi:hypothetical protein